MKNTVQTTFVLVSCVGCLLAVGCATKRTVLPAFGVLPPATPMPAPTLSPAIRGKLPPGAKTALAKAGITLDRVTFILNDDRAISGDTHFASGTTENGTYGSAIDILPAATKEERRREIRALRLAGFAAWSRGPGEPGSAAGNGPHYHLIWAGAKTKNRSQAEQICSFVRGLRGLARGQVRDRSILPDERAAVRKRYEAVYGRGALRGCETYENAH